ncbi:MAG: O-antigen ligase family protein [Peptococcaceae bacterium]|nr:O-antigen ligase family protein [Peptococcaceae bacterium]
MNAKEWVIAGLFAVISIAVLALVRFEFKTTMFFLLSSALLVISIIDIKLGVLLMLVFRSTIDAFMETSINIAALDVSMSSLFAAYAVVLIAAYLVTNKIIIKNNIAWGFYAFIAIGLLTALLPGNYGFGLVYVIKFISMLCIYLIVYYLCERIDNFDRVIMKGIIAAAVIPLAVGLYQLIFSKGLTNGFYAEANLNRLYGTLAHPNVFAFFLIIILVTITIYLLRYNKKNILLYIVAGLCLVELYATYTRGAWLGLALICSTYLIFSKMPLSRKLGYSALLLLAVSPFMHNIADRFTNVLSSDVERSSLATRFAIWQGMGFLFYVKPFLGYGIGAFKELSTNILNWNIEAHNDYLKLLLETGLIGLGSYLVLQFNTLRGIIRRKRENYLVAFVFVAVFYLMSLADNIIDMTVCQWYIWALVAIFTSRAKGGQTDQVENNAL